jgi:DNA-binding transcriptional MerR regulator
MKRNGSQLLKIGEIARLMGVEAQTIRNYEKQGLLKPVARSEGGHSLYGQEEVARARFIKRAKLAGLTLAEVKGLLALVAEGERGDNIPRLKEVLEKQLQKTEVRMEELSAFRDSLLHYRGWFEEEEDQGQR